MSKKYKKTITREIRSSFGRFIAIIAIVALGVGFLVGILSSTPDMKATANKYYTDYAMSDFDLKSTMGFTEKDIKAISSIAEVETVMPATVMDSLVKINDEAQVTGRIHGLDLKNQTVNKLQLIEGRMPENRRECVIEKPTTYLDDVAVGDIITVSGDNDDVEDTYRQTEFKVVGIVDSPYYFCTSKEPSSVGTGRTGVIMYTYRSAFETDVYTDLFVRTDTDLNAFSDKYEEFIETVTDKIEDISDERIPERRQEVVDEAMAEVNDAKDTLASEKADAEEKLADAEKELDDGQKEYEDGVAELNEAKAELADGRDEVNDAKSQFSEGKAKLEDSKTELYDAEDQLNSAKADLDKGKAQLDSAGDQITDSKAELDAAEDQIIASKAELDAAKSQLDQNKDAIEAARAAMQAGAQLPEETIAQIAVYDQSLAQWESGMAEWQAGKDTWDKSMAEWQTGKDTWDKNMAEWQSGMDAWESSYAQWESGVSEYEAGVKELNKSEEKINSAEEDLNEAEALIAENEVKLNDAAKELADGRAELEENRAEAYAEFAEAEAEIAEAEAEIADIEEPEWYILDRDSNLSYAKYSVDVEKVASIATVFPIFFFLVAALVSLTTMTRMVEEERIQIGTLKALGYRRLKIMSKYLIYCGAATVIGCVIGLLAGFQVLPTLIFAAFESQYDLPDLILQMNVKYAVLSCGLEVLCTLGATWMACYQTLREKPSQLMIPRAPKAGKRILLERIGFIWKKLSFTYKATARNVFRYKKHMLMTIVGIAGCTALIVAGLGIQDSLTALAKTQFNEILKYDMRIDLNDEKSDETLDSFLEDKDSLQLMSAAFDIEGSSNNEMVSATMYVPAEPDRLKDFVELRESRPVKDVAFGEDSVVISEKTAEVLEVSSGDTIKLTDADGASAEFVLTGITENYAGCYVYVAPDQYTQKFGVPEFNCWLLDSGITGQEAQDEVTAALQDSEYVSTVEFTSQSQEGYQIVLESLEFLVYVLVIFAGLLAVVVLYNLTNININERIRELATLRVLGYHHKEVAMYIFREIGILTIMGTVAGLILGKILHYYIVLVAESPDMVFGRQLDNSTFILAAVITIAFSVLVDALMLIKLKRIDMAASMKAVD